MTTLTPTRGACLELRQPHAVEAAPLFSTSAMSSSSQQCHLSLISKVQGGTGKHVDGSVTEPLMGRPFQALVQCCDARKDGKDGGLRVLPGFHAAAVRYFQLVGQPPPEGGFTPLHDHEEITGEDLWVPARRLPKRWRQLHAAGKLPPACGAAQARTCDGLAKKLRALSAELDGGGGTPPFGECEPAQAGDYILWDLGCRTRRRARRSTAAASRAGSSTVPMLARGNEARRRAARVPRNRPPHAMGSAAQRDDEVRGYAGAAPIEPAAAQLYGYCMQRPKSKPAPTKMGESWPVPSAAESPTGANGDADGRASSLRGRREGGRERSFASAPMSAEEVAAWEAAEALLDVEPAAVKGRAPRRRRRRRRPEARPEGGSDGEAAATAKAVATRRRWRRPRRRQRCNGDARFQRGQAGGRDR